LIAVGVVRRADDDHTVMAASPPTHDLRVSSGTESPATMCA
jgi:hypothetical protein